MFKEAEASRPEPFQFTSQVASLCCLPYLSIYLPFMESKVQERQGSSEVTKVAVLYATDLHVKLGPWQTRISGQILILDLTFTLTGCDTQEFSTLWCVMSRLANLPFKLHVSEQTWLPPWTRCCVLFLYILADFECISDVFTRKFYFRKFFMTFLPEFRLGESQSNAGCVHLGAS